MASVICMGTYDQLHEGHLNQFKAAIKLAGEGGSIYVGVNSDKFTSSYKRKPSQSEEQRVKAVKNGLKKLGISEGWNFTVFCKYWL